jgi:glycosyltransferase involved in cell wall biosynthesis
MSPRISVVMPAFNAEQTVGAAISSVLWQTYADRELVLVNDGSTDRTASIGAAYGDEIRVVSQQNGGVAAARNRGIEEARGELIAFCDADDVLLPRHLDALVGVFDENGGIATSNCYWLFPGGLDPSKIRYKGRFPAPEHQRLAILEQNFVSTISLFPKALVDKIGPFDPARRQAEDWDFWLRAIYAGHRVFLQRQPLALYRWGATGLSADRDEMDAHIDAVLHDAAARDDLQPDERAYLERRLAGPGPRRLSRGGDEALRAGRYREAAGKYGTAASLCPSERPLVWKARLLRLAPSLVGPLVRARQRRIEAGVGFEERHIR